MALFREHHVRWTAVEAAPITTDAPGASSRPDTVSLVTWNVDAASTSPEARISAIVAHILSCSPPVDVILLQEVSRPALASILENACIRKGWYSSEADAAAWGVQSFASMTLVSKRSFGDLGALGPVWRVKYPSRFGRDALCCDIFASTTSQANASQRVRLTNVHLDSLPIRPSNRPRQICIAADFVRAAGRGLVAGDFNPVLDEDGPLIALNGLEDAWLELHKDEPGFTWGVDGKQPFPPARLDRVATKGLEVTSIDVMRPGGVSRSDATSGRERMREETDDGDGALQWSDHSGLRCSFRLSKYNDTQ